MARRSNPCLTKGTSITMKPQGICLRERTIVMFPDGSIRQGAIWQHTEGVRRIYAIAPDEEGMLNAFALEPVWVVRSGENGQAVWQGMGVTNWLVEFWAGLKVLLSKGRTRRIRRHNLA